MAMSKMLAPSSPAPRLPMNSRETPLFSVHFSFQDAVTLTMRPLRIHVLLICTVAGHCMSTSHGSSLRLNMPPSSEAGLGGRTICFAASPIANGGRISGGRCRELKPSLAARRGKEPVFPAGNRRVRTSSMSLRPEGEPGANKFAAIPAVLTSLLISTGGGAAPAYAGVDLAAGNSKPHGGDIHAEARQPSSQWDVRGVSVRSGPVEDGLWPPAAASELLVADAGGAAQTKGIKPDGAATTTATDAEHAVANEILDLVDKHFYDLNNEKGVKDSASTHVYNGISWDQIRSDFQVKKLDGRDQTYKETEKLIKRLGDKYTRFLPPKEFVKLTKYDSTGVGLLLVQRGGGLYVSSPPLVGSTSAEAGVKKGDRIVSIDGADTRSGKSPFEGAELLSGKAGTSARVVIDRDGNIITVDLERKISVENPVTTYVVTAKDGCRVGYMKVKEFNGAVKRGVSSALKELKEEGVDSYMLDLRGNLGGVLEGSLEIAGLFMDEGPSATEKRTIVYVQDRSGKEEPIWAQPRLSVDTKTPVFVLVDKRSASASEVLAGSLQDNCRAVVVGKENSFGKGLIQGAFPVTDGSGVVMTVASYLTPKMKEIQGKGVVPDFKMDPGDARKTIKNGKFDLKEAQKKIAACVPPPQAKDSGGFDEGSSVEQLNGDQGKGGEESLFKAS